MLHNASDYLQQILVIQRMYSTTPELGNRWDQEA